LSQGDLGTDKLFTGQKLDSTGLYFYNARYYDPAIGRFISADTIVQSISNPQVLNRYSYALNNPLKYTEPSGHVNLDTFDGWMQQDYEQVYQYSREKANEAGDDPDLLPLANDIAYSLLGVNLNTPSLALE
jgi:RHS repeat-associated protein